MAALPDSPTLPSNRTHHAGLQRVHLLGAARLCGAPGQPEHLLGRNDALLLALLAHRGPLPRSEVAALLWPDHPPATAARNLRQRVHQLKRAAGRGLLLGDPVLALAPGVLHDVIGDEVQLVATLAADPQALRGALLAGITLDGAGGPCPRTAGPAAPPGRGTVRGHCRGAARCAQRAAASHGACAKA